MIFGLPWVPLKRQVAFFGNLLCRRLVSHCCCRCVGLSKNPLVFTLVNRVWNHPFFAHEAKFPVHYSCSRRSHCLVLIRPVSCIGWPSACRRLSSPAHCSLGTTSREEPVPAAVAVMAVSGWWRRVLGARFDSCPAASYICYSLMRFSGRKSDQLEGVFFQASSKMRNKRKTLKEWVFKYHCL